MTNSTATQRNLPAPTLGADPLKMYLAEISKLDFQAIVREHERTANAGCTATFNSIQNRTRWLISNKLVAVSEGPVGSNLRYWAVLSLTSHQHSIVVDQISNNDVSGDEELIDHVYVQARILRPEALAILVERNRCLVDPFYEPLQDTYVDDEK